jgi:hypothetical protein
MKKKQKYGGIEVIISGITAIIILISFKTFMPIYSCSAEITKYYNIFFALMQVITIIFTSYGLYLLIKSVISNKK